MNPVPDRSKSQSRTRRRRGRSVADFEELFHLVIENVKDYAIFILDPNGRALTWNAGVKRLLGYDEEEFAGLAFQLLFRPAEQEAAQIEMQKAAATGRSDDERWHVRKDGTELWVTGVLTALKDPAGRLRGYAKIMRDTTAQRQAALEREALLRAELLARTEAEQANRLKDEFLASVSHELRTPLNAILGWARMLANEQLDESMTKRALAAVERNATLQSRLVEGLLDVSRIVSGKFELNVQPVSVPQLLKGAIDSLQHAASAKGVTIAMAVADDLEPIEADAERLQQVMLNLLTNAIKFTPQGGRIDAEVASRKDDLELTVRDTGEGIAPDVLPHIFERFHHGVPGRGPGAGLGLGLTITRHIVEAHGGSIEARSEGEGKGATFVVRIPRTPASTRNVTPPPPSWRAPIDCPPDIAGRRVLIVEDQPDSRELAAFVLGHCGMQVISADSAGDALRLLDAHDVDVIVSDVGLAGDMDGLELIREVRSRPEPVGRIPAVVVSAHANNDDRTRALAAGYELHVSKPLEPAELIQAVSALLRREQDTESRDPPKGL
jgi:PAS domain S-box-containing protein